MLNLFIIVTLFSITIYTFGFAITLWKEKQKGGAFAVLCLVSLIVVLPFFTIFKS
ncbi:hypothetical protein JMM81_20245 [Bacillus sp. V3B]|uniref:hypothetical protein n=1 Tax=Bacillus sp. V3B TaxID=2804915 RepID=UPI00210AE206|nr:hypothetical protein [Bacillus sp. V3B]MCQ6277208.1 hypothetical protein [Bacillus sp. V3B]